MDSNTPAKIHSLAYASIVSVFLYIISIYVYGIDAIRWCGWESQELNSVCIAINTRIPIFSNQLLYKLLILLLLTPSLTFGINKPLKKYNHKYTIILLIIGTILFLMKSFGGWYILLTTLGFLSISIGLIRIDFGEQVKDNEDIFNDIEEAFPQEEIKRENPYSVNLPMYYYLKNHKNKLEKRNGFINIINVFGGTLVMGTAGSGKTFAVIEPFMQQLISKGFAAAIYDFKYPTLSKKVYNYFLHAYKEGVYSTINHDVTPHFYSLNFDNPAYSHRANPISPSLLREDVDAINVAINVMCALVPQWRKEADFFANSAMNIFAAILLYLRGVEGGRFCTFAHAVEFLSIELDKLIPILLSKKQLQNITKPFENAFKTGAVDQIQGQIASAQIPLARLATENVYFICTGDDFELDVNDPQEPKIVTVGNNTLKVEAYATPLSLYFYQIIQQVNQQNKWPSFLSIDEFPTIYLSSIDRTINTARSNKVAVLLGYQDNTQLYRDYGEAQAKVIINSPGNFFAGQVQGETAEMLSKFFGKKIQQRKSHSLSETSISQSVNEQLEEIFPPNKISNLSQGAIIGKIADNFDQRVKEKLFSCTIDTNKIKVDESNFVELPIVTRFPKDTVPEDYLKEFMLDYSSRFTNPDVDHIMQIIMQKSDQDNLYKLNTSDFNLTEDNISPQTRNVIFQKFGSNKIESKEIKQFIFYVIGKLLSIGFITESGHKETYYVAIWMRAHIRQHYYQIKKDIVDLVERTEQELLADPECLKYFRTEYLQRLRNQYDEEEEEIEIDMSDNSDE